MNQKLSGVMLLGGVAVFLYKLGELLQRHSAWADFYTPAGAGELLVMLGGVAVGLIGALGLNLGDLLQGMASSAKRSGSAIILAAGLGAAVASGACATLGTGTASTAPAIDKAAILKVATTAENVGLLLKNLQGWEIAFYREGKVAPETHRAFQTGAKKFAEGALLALDSAKDVTRSAATRKALLNQSLTLGTQFLEQGIVPIADAGVRDQLRAALAGIQALLIIAPM